jgi:hypothetical protein
MDGLVTKIAVAGAGITLGVGLLAGCGDKYTQPFQDSGRTSVVNNAPVDIITDADGFSNASTKCDHGNRLYFVYHGDSPYGAVAVVPKDPTCPQK